MEAELASLQQLNAGLQRDLARFQEREDLLKQARRSMPAARPYSFAAGALARETLACCVAPRCRA